MLFVADNRARKFEPAGASRSAQVIDPGSLAQRRHAEGNEFGGCLRERAAPVGNAELVGDDFELIALGRETFDRQQEVRSPQAVDPARTQDEALGSALSNRALSCELALAIDIERSGRVVLGIGSRGLAVEFVVAPNAENHPLAYTTLFRQDTGRDGVD